MALNSSIVQCLPILSSSTHSLPIGLKSTVWFGYPHKPPVRSTWTALPSVSKPPRSWNHQQCSFRTLARPHLPHHSAQPLKAFRVTPLMPGYFFQGIRTLHSDTSDQDQAAGNEFSFSFWSSCLLWSLFVAWISYKEGREEGVKEVTAQHREATFLNKREALRREEEALKHNPRTFMGRYPCGKSKCTIEVRHDESRKKRREIAGKIEALDMKELEDLKRRVVVLQHNIETRRKSMETDKADETPLGEVLATHFRTQILDGLYYTYVCEEEEETTIECPLCTREEADPRTRKANMSLSVNIVPQIANQALDADQISKSLPLQDKCTSYTKPDTNSSKTPITNTRQTSASTVVLETLSAERCATKEEMSQIKQAKEALTSREKELETKTNDRKKRIQELNAPKSDQTWPVVQGMLFGSALAIGVMTAIFRS